MTVKIPVRAESPSVAPGDDHQKIVLENSETRIAADAKRVERRACTRRVVSGLALVPVDIGPDCGFGLLVDLSESGASIQGVVPLDKSGTKTLAWTFPGQETSIEVRGRVTWSDNNLFGIAFTEVSDYDRARIKNWVEDHTRDSFSEPNPDIQAREPVAELSPPDIDTPHPADHTDGDSMWKSFQLGLLADHVRSSLSADGVAIAVASGSSFVCQASAGRAPDLGAIADSGLSAECIRTGTVICCADAQNDPRVDVQVRDSLKLGSAIVFPVTSAGNLLALLETFWIRANAFADSDLASLSDFADSVLKILAPDRESPTGNAPPNLFDRKQPITAAEKDADSARQWPHLNSWHIPDQPAQAVSGASVFARFLVLATGFLGVLAVLTGISLWYFTTAKPTLAHDSTSTQAAIATTPDKTAVVLPEIEPATSPVPAVNASTERRLGNGRGLAVSAIEFTPAGSPRQVTADSASASGPASGKGPRVVLEVHTDDDGRITNVRVVSGDPELAQLAKSALADKRYSPVRGSKSGSRRGQIVVSFVPRP